MSAAVLCHERHRPLMRSGEPHTGARLEKARRSRTESRFFAPPRPNCSNEHVFRGSTVGALIHLAIWHGSSKSWWRSRSWSPPKESLILSLYELQMSRILKIIIKKLKLNENSVDMRLNLFNGL
jgi:hypothetical protein